MKNRIIKFLGWALAAVLLLVVAARLSLAPLVSGAIEDWFEDQGVTASIDELGFELQEGRVALRGLKASREDEQVLALGGLEIGWSWSDLRENRLRIDSIRIDGLELDVERLEDGRMYIAGIDLSAGTASEESDAAAEPGEPLDWTLQLPRFEMAATRLCYRAPGLDFCNALENLDWNGSLNFDLAKLESETLPLEVDGEFRLTGFESRSEALQRVLASFESLAFEGIAIETGGEIALDAITLETFELFEREVAEQGDTEGGKFIEHADSVQVNDIRLHDGKLLTVAEVLVAGNATQFIKANADGYEIDAWLTALGRAPEPAADTTSEAPATDDSPGAGPNTSPTAGKKAGEVQAATEARESAAAEPPAPAPEPPPARAFDFAVGKLVFETEKPLRYRDLTLAKPFAVGLSSSRLVVESLDSRQPETPSNITFEARLDGDSLFEVAGTVTPLAAKISFDMEGQIRALDLRQLSPFTAAIIGHTIKSGQLDADIDLQAEQNIMNSKIELILYRFDLEAVSEADAAAMEERFGFPLGPSLALLKNREGNIELDMPLSGDLENPDFGTGEIVTREISKAITSAVLTFYTPFGLITAADMVFSLATALKFEPVIFDSGTSKIGADQHGSLDRIAALMQEKPGIQLRLCPHSNTADRKALLPGTARLAAEDLEPHQLSALSDLGEERISAIEQYLAGKQIDPARLIPCASTHEEDESPARVEITI